ncbi:hypothetical protein D1007_16062 [Hordeum vulgare]|nr:hypothetical protein D1007_16062 [Hordeum vulgare]
MLMVQLFSLTMGNRANILHDSFNNLVGTSWSNTNYFSFDADPLLQRFNSSTSAQAGDHTSLNLNTVRYWPRRLQVLNLGLEHLGQIQQQLVELRVVLVRHVSVAVAAGKLAPGVPRRVAARRRRGEGRRRQGLYRPLDPFRRAALLLLLLQAEGGRRLVLQAGQDRGGLGAGVRAEVQDVEEQRVGVGALYLLGGPAALRVPVRAPEVCPGVRGPQDVLLAVLAPAEPVVERPHVRHRRYPHLRPHLVRRRLPAAPDLPGHARPAGGIALALALAAGRAAPGEADGPVHGLGQRRAELPGVARRALVAVDARLQLPRHGKQPVQLRRQRRRRVLHACPPGSAQHLVS